MAEFLTDDLGNPSWLRKSLTKTHWWFMGINTFIVVYALIALKISVNDLLNFNYLTFFFGGFSIIFGSKIGQKIVENQKEIQMK